MRFLLVAIVIATLISLSYRASDTPVLRQPEIAAAPVAAATTAQPSMPTIETANVMLAINQPHSDVKATVVYLYTSWCPYCKKQYPVIAKLAEEMGPRGLQVVGLSVEKSRSAASEFLNKQPVPQPFQSHFVTDPANLLQSLRNKQSTFRGGIPHMIVFDSQGRMLDEFNGLSTLPELKASLPPL